MVKSRRVKNIFIFLIFLIVQMFVCIWFGGQKQTFFTDEVYSYSFANNEEEINLAGLKRWVPTEYIVSGLTTTAQKRFSFKPAYQNQVKDVHPPLYYFLIHFFSSFSGDTLTKWTGIALNLVILFFIDIAFLKLSFLLNQNNSAEKYLPLCLWTFCAAGLSNILFIRMYLLLSLEIITYIYLHQKIIYIDKEKSTSSYIFLCLNVIAGGLTHYYFYLFAFAFSFIVCAVILIQKRYKTFFTYLIALFAGLIFNSIYFSAMWEHILHGYRGIQVIRNVTLGNRFQMYGTYLDFINQSLSGGILPYILLVVLMLLIYRNIRISKDTIEFNLLFQRKHKELLYWGMVFATIVYMYVAIKGSELIENRYLYPIYPLLAIIIINVILYTFKQLQLSKKLSVVLISIVIVCMCYCSLERYGIYYNYSNQKEIAQKAESLKGSDCLFYIYGHSFDWYTGITYLFNYDNLYFYDEDNLQNLKEVFEKRKSKKPLLLALPSDVPLNEYNSLFNELSKNGYPRQEFVYQMPPTDIYSYSVYKLSE